MESPSMNWVFFELICMMLLMIWFVVLDVSVVVYLVCKAKFLFDGTIKSFGWFGVIVFSVGTLWCLFSILWRYIIDYFGCIFVLLIFSR